MHKEILSEEQEGLLPLVKEFHEDFFLVGGTAIALHLGHRRSIDFDLFTFDDFSIEKIHRKILRHTKIENVFIKEEGEYTISVHGVKLTFLTYPYHISPLLRFEKDIRLPNLLTLAAMKAFALGRRAKWKDYVDLYFILRDRYTLEDITKKGKKIFGGEFNERIFREALGYFKDVNYDEKVIFMKGFEVSDKEVQKTLLKFSLE